MVNVCFVNILEVQGTNAVAGKIPISPYIRPMRLGKILTRRYLWPPFDGN